MARNGDLDAKGRWHLVEGKDMPLSIVDDNEKWVDKYGA